MEEEKEEREKIARFIINFDEENADGIRRRHAEFFESSSEDGIVSKACTWEWWPSPVERKEPVPRP